MANVGYQMSDIFIRPEGRLIKASDINLDEDFDLVPDVKENSLGVGSGSVGRVEYDMDLQDDKWLEAYNFERKASGSEAITREMFEITITTIEKEWYALERRIPKPNPKPPQTHRPRSSSAAAVNGEPQAGEEQDSKCAICDDGDCENTNAIVFCDGCDLAVHQECYGVPFIPEGQWLCRKCQLIGRGIPVSFFDPVRFCLHTNHETDLYLLS
jgi:NuA3 HAT complex component NTO1